MNRSAVGFAALALLWFAQVVRAAAPAPAADLPLSAAAAGFIQCDPAKVLGPDSCTKCHENEMLSWRETPHFATFETLHRMPEAKAIADRLGLRSVKRNDECTKCHFTVQEEHGRERVIAGVSCESCHGAGRDWIELHADYGGPTITRAMESPEHRAERIEKSIAAGMNNPANLYLVARQCLACHTSPNERLVNVGGHAAGTPDFELVAWSQGKVRHNFLRSGEPEVDVRRRRRPTGRAAEKTPVRNFAIGPESARLGGARRGAWRAAETPQPRGDHRRGE